MGEWRQDDVFFDIFDPDIRISNFRMRSRKRNLPMAVHITLHNLLEHLDRARCRTAGL